MNTIYIIMPKAYSIQIIAIIGAWISLSIQMITFKQNSIEFYIFTWILEHNKSNQIFFKQVFSHRLLIFLLIIHKFLNSWHEQNFLSCLQWNFAKGYRFWKPKFRKIRKSNVNKFCALNQFKLFLYLFPSHTNQ